MADRRLCGILLTDLEGSTAHLRALGDDYASVLGRHHDIIRTAIAAEHGRELGSEGDSFVAVFPTTTDALCAAVAAQRKLVSVAWPDSPWRVRMAVHAGTVEFADAGVVGIGLHEAARVRAAAYGGQIVVTDHARAALGVPLPDGVTLIDLGSHSVRDFAGPVRLHQVSTPGLPSAFPPLRTMTARPVPTARTPFVGRAKELDELGRLIAESRLVTVTGAGGSGKTRLAYEAARRAEMESVVVVELAGVRDGSQVAAEVATAVGARHPDAIADAIGARDMLLVLDNCEHVVDAVAPFVSATVDGCAGLTVLATSREPLAVTGETVWPLPPLRLDDAMDLFDLRAAGPTSEAMAATVCERLGRMPLAIELAAARLRSMSADALVARLDDQLRLLTTGPRDDPRHQTLRRSLDWSHDLLTPDERMVFRQLGVFAGGFSLDAAEQVAGTNANVVDAVDGLVLKSLVEPSVKRDRYHMLEPVRQYAVEQLTAAGEHDSVHESHARWASRFAREANRNLFVEQSRWTALLGGERENLGAAISWAIGHRRASLAAALVSNLARYWFHSARTDSFVWVPQVLAHIDELDVGDRGKVLLAAGITHCDFVADPQPVVWLRQAEQIFRELGNDRALGATLWWLGRAAEERNDFDAAEHAFTESTEIYERLGDRFGWGWSLTWIGVLARQRGDLDTGERIQRQVLAECETVPQVVAQAWFELAHIAAERDDLSKFDEYVARSIKLSRDLDNRWAVAIHTATWAAVHLSDTRSGLAAEHAIEALTLLLDLGADPDIAPTLETAAILLLKAGKTDQVSTIAGAVHDKVTKAHSDAFYRVNAMWVSSLQSLLTDPAWKRQVERGRRLGVRDAAHAAIAWLAQSYPEQTIGREHSLTSAAL